MKNKNDRPPRVAVLLNDFVVGGVSSVVLGLWKNTPEGSVDYTFIKASSYRCETDDLMDSLHIPVYTLPIRRPISFSVFSLPLNDYRRMRDIRKLLKKTGPYDAIHIHDFSFSALIAAKSAGIPIRIAQSHLSTSDFDGAEKESKITAFFWKWRQRIYNRYATCRAGDSEKACRAMFGERAFSPDSPPTVITPGLDLKKFDLSKKTATESKKSFPTEPDAIRLLHVGRFVGVKNQRFILDVLAGIIAKGKKVELFLVGSGDLKEELMQYAETLSVSRFVHFYPPDADVPLLMAGADFFLLPSFSEGFGLVLTEAQAMRLRCVASNTVSTETNAGLVRYLPIDQGASCWVDHIIEDYPKPVPDPDPSVLSRYDVKTITQNVVSLYYQKP